MNSLLMRKFLLFMVFILLDAKLFALELSDLPLFVSTAVPANVIVSMDDSGSMAWGFMPDKVASSWRQIYYRSASFNKIYYDPLITYQPPNNADGQLVASASYGSAIRGYFYEPQYQQNVDLETEFTAIYDHYYQDSTPDLLGSEESIYGCSTYNNGPCQPQAAYYYQLDKSLTGCHSSIDQQLTDVNCYKKIVIDQADYSLTGSTNDYGRTYLDERTNFANWYQFYAIRGDVGKTALMRAFTPEAVNSSIRIGRQGLNTDRAVSSGTAVNDLSTLDPSERNNFYQWLKEIPTSGGTPLRSASVRAGDYYSQVNAYRDQPSSGSSDVIACRLNTHIMLTDGFYNGSFALPDQFFHDSDNGRVLPDGKIYDSRMQYQKIYGNANSRYSLADIMWHYWATDLAPTLSNNIQPFFSEEIYGQATDQQYWQPNNDPANWQHMVSYLVSFGLSGTVPTTQSVMRNLIDGEAYVSNDGSTQLGWPDIGTGKGIADDIYHAGINGRGGFYNATDANELVVALKTITERIASRESTASTVVAKSGRISSGNLVYLSLFDADKWIGRLQAFEVSNGNDFDSKKVLEADNCNAKPFGSLCNLVWDAAERNTELSLPSESRAIFSFDSSVNSNQASGINFRWASLNTQQKSLLNNGDGMGQLRLDYIRGDGGNEIDRGGFFRSRVGSSKNATDTRLGPIMHSSPIYVGNGKDDNGFRQFSLSDDLEAKPYSDFLASISDRQSMIYVGANDGMLHAYQADSKGGNEVFSYIPNQLMASLPNLMDENFSSVAFVDGPLSSMDVFYDNDWHSVLVGGFRSGGKGYFSLDITDPNASANKVVRWEFTDEADNDMGFSYGKAQIVRLNSGRWVAIVANGYNSAEQKAVLYVLDISDGSIIKKITVDTAGDNGLSSPIAVSTNNDFNIDVVYAGDLKGNVWRFDLTSVNSTDWIYSKLFSTEGSRPITGAITVGNHPANLNGRVVYFGTGEYLQPSDLSDSATEYFYAIADNDSCLSATACVHSSQLISQTIDSAEKTGRTISNHRIDWQQDKGWRLPLSAINGVAERVVGRPLLIGSQLVFNSIVPSSDRCNSGGETFTYSLNRNNGGLVKAPTIDFNADGLVDQNDNVEGNLVVAGRLDSVSDINDDPIPELIILSSADGQKRCVNVAGRCMMIESPDRSGRVSWLQIK